MLILYTVGNMVVSHLDLSIRHLLISVFWFCHKLLRTVSVEIHTDLLVQEKLKR